jgi:hypothetical protein
MKRSFVQLKPNVDVLNSFIEFGRFAVTNKDRPVIVVSQLVGHVTVMPTLPSSQTLRVT